MNSSILHWATLLTNLRSIGDKRQHSLRLLAVAIIAVVIRRSLYGRRHKAELLVNAIVSLVLLSYIDRHSCYLLIKELNILALFGIQGFRCCSLLRNRKGVTVLR